MTSTNEELERRVVKMEHTLYGNESGKDGIELQLKELITIYNDRERGKAKYDDRQATKTNILIALAALMVAILSLILAWNHENNKSLLKVDHSENYAVFDNPLR